ncbi:phage integrase [Enterococcus faecium 1,231,501]|nr:phage integrase [Enterococcus faecium 1,231,501]KST45611.1 integrase [Enterococcus faecium]MBK4880202.1 phage integrase [Enterococcus faecium]
MDGEFFTAEELIEWIEAAQNDLNNDKIILQDYVLFMLTMHLGDRKSESYALQWQHIDFNNRRIILIQSQDRYGVIKSTKGNKHTIFNMPDLIYDLLVMWKKHQKAELDAVGLKQTENQRLFSYINRRGEVNQPVHIDYLNRRINAIRQRHPYLASLTPHKLRHTFGTLASLGSASMNSISKALTHSELKTTRIYVNAPDFIDSSVYDSFASVLERAKAKV